MIDPKENRSPDTEADKVITALDYLEAEDKLITEAAEVSPFDHSFLHPIIYLFPSFYYTPFIT
jgi:hypothetical protein